MGIDDPTFAPKSGQFLLIQVKVLSQKVGSIFEPILRASFSDEMLALSNKKSTFVLVSGFLAVVL